MKKLLIILLLILSILCVSCQKEIAADTKTITSIITVTSIVEDTQKIDELEKELSDSREETEEYQKLISGLNSLLRNVYYGYQKKSDGSSSWGTGFSIEYKEKYFLVTAGHIVDSEYGVFKNLGFKANFSDEWIYPKLLVYENDFQYGKDYAVFYSDKIDSGFKTGKYELPAFILGNGKLNIIKDNTSQSISGESGSPIININGEVIGIMTGASTNIDYVLEAIDNLE